MMPEGASAWQMSCVRYSLVSEVMGLPEKWMGTQTAPRRPTDQVATGESKPEDRSVTTLPAVPTGRPPQPRSESAYTKTSPWLTRTFTWTSGWCIWTFFAGKCSQSTPPTKRLMSMECSW